MKFDKVTVEMMLRQDGCTPQWEKDQYGKSSRLGHFLGMPVQMFQVEPEVKP